MTNQQLGLVKDILSKILLMVVFVVATIISVVVAYSVTSMAWVVCATMIACTALLWDNAWGNIGILAQTNQSSSKDETATATQAPKSTS